MPDLRLHSLRIALEHALDYLEGLDRRAVHASAETEELRKRLASALPDHGTPATRVIEDLIAATAGGHLGSAGGRFFAWVISGSLESALAADWLTSTWDQNAALYASGPAAAVVEEVVGGWLLDMFGLPVEASFALITGCQMAHFTCLAAARYAVLKRARWDVNEEGLIGAPPVRVIASDQRHATVDRAVRFLGIGSRNIISVATDQEGRIDIQAFQRSITAEKSPTIVVLNAGDVNIAAFDPFADLIPIAKANGAWVHVDGAFGLFARASRSKRWLASGIELADSWATDGHKWLNVPFDCGMAFVRDREAHRASMTVAASYITAEKSARDQIDWNPEWSRRGRGFVVYAALKELGRTGVETLIDRCCSHADAIVTGIGALPGAEVLWKPRLNQGLVRFRDSRPDAVDRDHDGRTDQIISAVNATGEAFFSGTTWRGVRAMRVSVVNWRTTESDVRRTISAVAQVLGAARPSV